MDRVSIWRRLKYLLPSTRRAEERDIQEELQSLRSMAGPRVLGNLTLAAEDARAEWGWNWIENTWQDARYALRTLLRHRRVTFVALLSLVLGIGVNTLVFTVVNALLLRPLPYPERERIVLVASVPQDKPQQTAGLTRSHCATLRSSTDVFEHFGCYTDPVSASLAEDDSSRTRAQRIMGRQFTAGAGRALGIHPVLGRWFDESAEREGAERVLVIGFSLWQVRFGGSSDVLGKRVRFNGEPATIIGVMPKDFEFLDLSTDYWTPFQSRAYGANNAARILGGLARLQSGIPFTKAQSRMDAMTARLAEESPKTNTGWRIGLRPLERLDDQSIYSEARNPILTLQSSVGFVLLIACANVAGLLLAQGTSQHKELAVRAALGSGRWRIFRQLITHSLLLAFIGGTAGLVAGLAGVRVLSSAISVQLPDVLYETHLDPTVLLFTLGISALSGLVVGIIPALQISHAEPLDAMRDSSARTTAGRSRQRLRSAFVTGQIALALMLLVGAGLMLNSLVQLAAQPLGFDPKDLATVEVQLPDERFRRPTTSVLASGALEVEIDPQMYVVTEKMRENLGEIRGVMDATGIAIRPPFGGRMNMPVRIEANANVESAWPQFLPILPNYFATLQVRIVQGREFTPQDRSGSLPVAVINRAMADRYWPNASAVGKYVTINTPVLPNQPGREIVGVVEEVNQFPGPERPAAALHSLSSAVSSTRRTVNERSTTRNLYRPDLSTRIRACRPHHRRNYCRGQRTGCLVHPQHERHGLSQSGATPDISRIACRIRDDCHVACGCGRVWSDGASREPADERDRNSHSAWRGSRPGAVAGHSTGRPLDRGRPCDRSPRLRRADASRPECAVRTFGGGPVDADYDCRTARRHRAYRLLSARAPRLKNRSDACSAA
jgi:putative ABC transport system permease protein